MRVHHHLIESLVEAERNQSVIVVARDGLGNFSSIAEAIDSIPEQNQQRVINEAIAHIHGETGKQAVALRISADMAAFYDCNFHGGQDTLYDHKGRHYFKRCFVQGSVDFIFGYGRSLYKDCHLYSIANKTGAITAQKRTIRNMNSGFSFVNCSITGSGRIYLGRAWGDRSRVVYSYTYMDALIAPQGWQNWNHPERNRTVFFAQYECSGPGAKTSQRVAWARTLTFEEAQPFLDTDFIHGETWLLST
ncbi:probable pectinesterase 53 [Selaginella moellendorffii]|uniref:probable pectinesterase 53 n=1 Tax=Selaginella moellendorffii TaxID=88036 RepID=UPI000D1C3877|nr:probable pectinesterase 53 [Selaginella moellendorffii]|eukprot:XP_024534848.1 probable pectinesterase 53 [Selaginella moellendorffii]